MEHIFDLDFSFEADFTAAKYYADKIIHLMLKHDGQKNLLLNVNIPKLTLDEIKGMKICEQGKGAWHEEFMESQDPRGEKYYWLTGRFKEEKRDNNSDLLALEQGYISIVPSQFDLTNYRAIEKIKYFEES